MRPDPDFRPIVTERLLLRRSRAEDAGTISAYRSDPDVHRYQGWDRTDPEGIREEIERMSERAPGDPAGWVQLSVEELGTGALIGDVGMSPAEGESGVIKLGYTMSPAAQGLGYATEAVTALVGYAFETLRADTVRAYASEENVPSIRVAQKAGLQLVERFERSYEGETWFGVRYELRRQDFEAKTREPGRTSHP
jgi:RimJ/RimL family protein N-acetyltransferase